MFILSQQAWVVYSPYKNTLILTQQTREYVHKHISKYMKAQVKVFLFRQVSVNTFTNMPCSNKHKSIWYMLVGPGLCIMFQNMFSCLDKQKLMLMNMFFSQIHVGKLINIHWICFTIPIIYEHVFLFQKTNYYFPHLNRRKWMGICFPIPTTNVHTYSTFKKNELLCCFSVQTNKWLFFPFPTSTSEYACFRFQQ